MFDENLLVKISLNTKLGRKKKETLYTFKENFFIKVKMLKEGLVVKLNPNSLISLGIGIVKKYIKIIAVLIR